MARPKRDLQFTSNEVCIVHAIQRCVRRAFLTGVDSDSGIDYSYRREWIRRRLETLASCFGVDVLNYAIMSNHFHLILRNRPDVVQTWTDIEVATRWLRLFPGRRIDERLAEPVEADIQRLAADTARTQQIRQRLSNISWFMRALSEPIARMANRQDKCTGRFWEGRFKAQRIADESGLLACAMYIDLNPIRAGVADSPITAKYTSANDRILATSGQKMDSAATDVVALPKRHDDERSHIGDHDKKTAAQRSLKCKGKSRLRISRDEWLAPFQLSRGDLSDMPMASRSGFRASDKGFLSMSFTDYKALLLWTSQQQSSESELSAKHASILAALGIEGKRWRDLVWNYRRYFGRASCAGRPESLEADAKRTGKRFHPGQNQCRGCFVTVC